MEYLKLNDNQLTGEIPSEIGNLYNLDVLFLDNNQLSGIIPNDICLRGLTWYLTLGSTRTKSSVSNNQLCPPYPSCVEDYVGVQDTTNCDWMKIPKPQKNKRSCLTMDLSKFRKEKWIVHPIRTLNNKHKSKPLKVKFKW